MTLPEKRMKKLGLLPRLLIAIGMGILCGMVAPRTLIAIFATGNGIFSNFLNFCIPLIIIGFVVPGIGDLGAGAGKTLALTAGIAYLSTILAGSIAYGVDRALFPSFLEVGSIVMSGAQNAEETMVPAFFEFQMPPLMDIMTALLMAFLLGLGIAVTKAQAMKKGFDEFQEVIFRLVKQIIIPLLPFHVFGIFANLTFSGTVFEILSVFIKVFGVILLLHLGILLLQYAIAGTAAHKNPLRLLKTMLPAYLTAIGTQSSAATIPVTVQCTEKNGVRRKIAEFVCPLCATIHLSGSTITITSCALAILLLNGQSIVFGDILPFILMLGVTMVAAPGVPGGAVMAALGILESMLGFNDTMLSLIIALYIAQDSLGTACNVTGDGAIAVLMDAITPQDETAA